MLFVNFEKECGESTFILVLKLLPGTSRDSARLHSAYNAIPAWLFLKAFEVSDGLWSKRRNHCGPMFWNVMRVQFFQVVGDSRRQKLHYLWLPGLLHVDSIERVWVG